MPTEPTAKEIRAFIMSNKMREGKALNDIAQAARALVPLLKDRQMLETAKDLESKLFMLDAIEGEMNAYFTENRASVVVTMLNEMRKGRGPYGGPDAD